MWGYGPFKGPTAAVDLIVATPGLEPPTDWVQLMHHSYLATGCPPDARSTDPLSLLKLAVHGCSQGSGRGGEGEQPLVTPQLWGGGGGGGYRVKNTITG